MSAAVAAAVQKPVGQSTKDQPVRTGQQPVVKARDPRAGLKDHPKNKYLSINTDLARATIRRALTLAMGTEPYLTADERVEAERLLARLESRQ